MACVCNLAAHDLLGEKFVRDIYLPVGNPETQWLYRTVHAGFALRLKSTALLLNDLSRASQSL